VFLCVIVAAVSMDMAMHCASQSFPANIREVMPGLGKYVLFMVLQVSLVSPILLCVQLSSLPNLVNVY